MKKYLLSMLFLILIFPSIVSAQEYNLAEESRTSEIEFDSVPFHILSNHDSEENEILGEAFVGDEVSFQLENEIGFQLKGIIVNTVSGKQIEIGEDDFVIVEGDTVILNKDKFIMPNENIMIEARWVPENTLVNPKTGTTILFKGFVIMVGLLAMIALCLYKEKKDFN